MLTECIYWFGYWSEQAELPSSSNVPGLWTPLFLPPCIWADPVTWNSEHSLVAYCGDNIWNQSPIITLTILHDELISYFQSPSPAVNVLLWISFIKGNSPETNRFKPMPRVIHPFQPPKNDFCIKAAAVQRQLYQIWNSCFCVWSLYWNKKITLISSFSLWQILTS